ncbi:UBX domain-containing protein 2 [Schistosoma japonicum]|nr:UBX domain-containing protein 2 [Schistosoma japonicum]
MLPHSVSAKCIREFCQVTGSDDETARSFLSACNNNIELAVSLYMDDPSRVPSQGPTEDYRTPIPQRNEQLLPVVVPLLPAHLQNSPHLQTRRRAFVSEDSDSSDDSTVTGGETCHSLEKTISSKSDHPVKQRYSNDIECNSTSLSADGVSSGSSSFFPAHANGVKDGVIKRKRKHLQQLYQPPVELLFNGTLHAAELAAQEKHRWLLVSVHDEGCFECHLLNRDVWKDPKIYQLIKRHSVFLQIPVDSPEGFRFRSTYSYVQSASHIAILDPFTGEQKMMWTHLNDPKIVYDVFTFNHVARITQHNLTDTSNVEYIDLSDSVYSSQMTCTTTTTTCPLDLTEEEQLQLAIEASKKEASKQPYVDDNEIVLTDDEDDDEYVNGNRHLNTDTEHQQLPVQEREHTNYTYEDDCIVVNYCDKPNSPFVSSTTAFITARRPLRQTQSLEPTHSNNDLKIQCRKCITFSITW